MITKEEFFNYMKTGREIEFIYSKTKKKYYVSNWISGDKNIYVTYEFNKDEIFVNTFEELCNIKFDGVTVLGMIESLTDNDVYYIY